MSMAECSSKTKIKLQKEKVSWREISPWRDSQVKRASCFGLPEPSKILVCIWDGGHVGWFASFLFEKAILKIYSATILSGSTLRNHSQRLEGPYVMLWMELMSAACKASTLPIQLKVLGTTPESCHFIPGFELISLLVTLGDSFGMLQINWLNLVWGTDPDFKSFKTIQDWIVQPSVKALHYIKVVEN